MATVPWFKSTFGLNNKVDSDRFEYSEKTGVVELAEAVNVDVGETGDVSRRLGFEATDITTECHSLFCEDSICLFVTGNALCILGEDIGYSPIRNVTPSAAMSYAQIGDAVYYSNGFELGIVSNGSSWTWDRPADVKLPGTTRTYSGPPLGNIIRFYAGRIWICKGNVIWYSEPFQYNVFNLAKNYIAVPGKIGMMAAVHDGFYISTGSGIYFYSGADVMQLRPTRITNYPAIPGTDTVVDGIAVSNGKYSNLLVPMWTSVEGICLGLPGGNMVNLTYDRLVYPRSISGCAVYTGKKYIVNLEP